MKKILLSLILFPLALSANGINIKALYETYEDTDENKQELINYLENYKSAESRAALGPDALKEAQEARDSLSESAQELLDSIREVYPENPEMLPGAGRTPGKLYDVLLEFLKEDAE